MRRLQCLYCDSRFVQLKRMRRIASSFLRGLSLGGQATVSGNISTDSEFAVSHSNFEIIKCETCGREYLALKKHLVRTVTKDVLDKTDLNPERKEYIMEIMRRYNISAKHFLRNAFAVTLPKYISFTNSVKNLLRQHKEINVFFKNGVGSIFHLVLTFNKKKSNYTLDNIQQVKVMR